MAVELASGFVSLSVKLDGATKGLGKLFDSAQKQATSAGKKTGEAYTKALESELNSAEAQVKKFSDSRQKALDKEADAAGKTKVALEKLNEAREGGLSGSRLTQLETAHESAMRKQAAAAKDLARETDGLTQAQKRQSRAQDALDTNQGGGKKSGRFRSLFSGVGENAESEGASAAGRFSSGFSKAMKAAGALAIGGSIVGSLSKVVTTGLDFEKTMNTLSGVTGASADVMQRFRTTAKDLGNDVSLSNTSASDAALAMTELAKAGFNVDDAMTAAKGTLQLAAAAQIDAGQAAEIQANALQAFGLNADYAGKAADVLSNAANASSAEITDVAYAMQAGGSVARQTGVSFEDTAASIALLANNGIKGSDAGTLLKSALLKLQAPSDKAAGALESLGVTAFDANGNFEGMDKLFGQLGEASKRLTPEMYGFYTATAFGSDAARLAGVAAKDGSAGFIQMRDAMNKQGAAADLAAAQNQGLPGVIERIKNAASTLAITLFEKIQGPLQNIGNGVTDFIGKMQTAFENPAVGQAASNIGNALSGIGTALGSVMSVVGPALVAGLAGAVNLFTRFKDVIIPLVAGFVAYKVAVFATTIPLKLAAAAQLALNAAMLINPIGLVVAAIAGLIAGIVLLYNKNETFRNIVQGAWAAIKVAIGAVWGWITGTVVPGLKTAWDVLSTGALALWQNAIQPAWNGIKQVIGFAWEIISDIFNNWLTVGRAVGEGVLWLWNNAVMPAWEGIKTAFSAAWDFISPIFERFKAGWDTLKNGIVGAAGAIKDGITSAFSGLAGIIKAPLRALGSFLAAIPSEVFGINIPGADHLNSWGKSLQGLAGGGVVRGPGTGTSDSVLAWLSNGEGVVTARGMSNGGGAVVAALNAGWTPSADYLRAMFIGTPGYAEGLNPGADYLRSLVMKLWPGITSIGGRRAEDGFGEHSSGNALDIMIPNYASPQGMAMGNAVLAFLQKNGSALDVDGIIWRQTSYGYGGSLTAGKAMTSRGNDTQNHMDHVHVILGKGRGAGAAPTSVPSVGLSLPSGGSLSGGSLSGSSLSGSGGGSRGGATAKQLREADDRITDLQNRLDIAEQELSDVEANPKAKDGTKQRKRDARDKLSRDLQQAKDDKGALLAKGSDASALSGKSGGSGNDPFSKIFDGVGELGQLGIDGALESFLPPGFDSPMEWGLTKMAGGLLSFAGGLMPDPISRGIFGALGAGATGDAGGAASALAGIFSPQQQGSSNIIGNDPTQLSGTGYGDMGGAYNAGSAGPTNTGAPVDNSVNTTFSGPVNYDAVQTQQQSSNNMQLRRNFGTSRMVP